MKFKEYYNLKEMATITKHGKNVLADGQPLKQLPLESIHNNIVIFRKRVDDWDYDAGFTLVYFMDSNQSAQDMKNGKIKHKPFSQFRDSSDNGPFDKNWSDRNDVGQKNILGMIQGYTDKSSIFVDFMTVRPGYKRNSITSKMLQVLMARYPNANLTFSSPTDEGKMFIKKNTGKDWEKPKENPI